VSWDCRNPEEESRRAEMTLPCCVPGPLLTLCLNLVLSFPAEMETALALKWTDRGRMSAAFLFK
jgi:hypothetical protein